jgi:peptidoglycan/LPS O-acetylase OafA/YrhL
MAVMQQRKDIQGLRAVAVLLVVAGHLFPNTIKGGYIGVDIFFVISGFVITQQMTKSYLESQKGFLLHFYARRVRRILPSALLVTLSTIWATSYFLGPVASNEAKLDGGWATIFLSNFHFHNGALDYFSTGTQPSPLQHFWSLSIEEQFYLVWPALFLLLFSLPISLRIKQLVVGLLIIFSLFAALFQSEINQSPIFFVTWTRIWELGAGALLALTAKSIPLPRIVSTLLVLFLVVAGFVIPQTMQWPRMSTIPIIIVTLVLLLRNPRISKFHLLENRVAAYLGDLSYIIYLWHWPVLTIAKGNFRDLGAQEILFVIGVTAVLSVGTHHLFENPLRYSGTLIARPFLTISTGVLALSVTAIFLFTSYQS